jgi:hypothetical protein
VEEDSARGLSFDNFLGHRSFEEPEGRTVFFFIDVPNAEYVATPVADEILASNFMYFHDPINIHAFQWSWSIFLVIAKKLVTLFTSNSEQP